MGVFKKKPERGAPEWEQTLVADDDEPEAGDQPKSRFGFRRKRQSEQPLEDVGEDEPEAGPVEVPQADADDIELWDEDEDEEGDDETSPVAHLDEEEQREILAARPLDSGTPVVPAGAEEFAEVVGDKLIMHQRGMDRAAKTEAEGIVSPNGNVPLQEDSWTPRHTTTHAHVSAQVDQMTKPTRSQRSSEVRQWTSGDFGQYQPRPRKILLPADIIEKRILFESEGGFVVEVVSLDEGRAEAAYYSVPLGEDREAVLQSIKPGAYIFATPVSGPVVDALSDKRQPAKAGTDKITTWPIKHETDLVEIEGIGPKYQARLKELGYYTTDQLRLANPVLLARHVGATETMVRRWQSQAELALLGGVGKQLAELLVLAGIEGIADLRRRKPKELVELVKQVKQGRKVRISATGVGPKTAQRILRQARALRRRAQNPPKLGPLH